jgi:hypothetical protein
VAGAVRTEFDGLALWWVDGNGKRVGTCASFDQRRRVNFSCMVGWVWVIKPKTIVDFSDDSARSYYAGMLTDPFFLFMGSFPLFSTTPL